MFSGMTGIMVVTPSSVNTLDDRFSRSYNRAMQSDHILRLALDAHCDPRTVRRYLDGESVRPATEHAILDSAKKRKIQLPKRPA